MRLLQESLVEGLLQIKTRLLYEQVSHAARSAVLMLGTCWHSAVLS